MQFLKSLITVIAIIAVIYSGPIFAKSKYRSKTSTKTYSSSSGSSTVHKSFKSSSSGPTVSYSVAARPMVSTTYYYSTPYKSRAHYGNGRTRSYSYSYKSGKSYGYSRGFGGCPSSGCPQSNISGPTPQRPLNTNQGAIVGRQPVLVVPDQSKSPAVSPKTAVPPLPNAPPAKP